MKLFSFLVIALVFASCSEPAPTVFGKVNGVEYMTSTTYHDAKFTSLKSPVLLIGKAQVLDSWTITVQDANGEIITFGFNITLANNIGASRSVGDTIK